MLNTRQSRTAATIRSMRPATLDTISRLVFQSKAESAAARAQVHPKYRTQFYDACGLTTDAPALL